ncbi:MAG: cytidylate kinase-like family protein [Chloroflexi bacterium]|nr:cytidylate kinase-like family protein [Chloroflexota bacterium]
MAVITLGGLTGGGGRDLGPILAQRLEADYVDRLILTSVAREVGATVEVLHQREQRPPTRGERFTKVLQRILERSAVTGVGGDPYFGPGVAPFLSEEYEDLPQPTITRGYELEDDKYIEAIRTVLRDLALSDNVVIVGRGAYIILRDMPNVLRVGIVASFEDRVTTIMKRERLEQDRARETILARDEARALYFKRFFDIDDPDNPEHYHLVINASAVGMDYAADVVIGASEALRDGRLPTKAVVAV